MLPITEGRGFFIALEGPDGGGKTTQAARLRDWLESLGRRVIACRDPGGTALGDQLRALLLGRDGPSISLRAEMLMYMAARAQLVEEVIRPALDRGCDVVTDRYLLSNVVYQGVAGGLELSELWRVGRIATQGLFPDLTLVLDVAPEVASGRGVGAGRDRIEDRPVEYRTKVREGFLGLMMEYPAEIVLVDGGRDDLSVAQAIREEVGRGLGLAPRA
jgi:dTMP kinase